VIFLRGKPSRGLSHQWKNLPRINLNSLRQARNDIIKPVNKAIIARQPDNTIQLTITINKAVVKKSYNQQLAEAVKKAKIPGFRKGKAPKKLVEEKTDKNKVYEAVIQKLVPEAYLEAIKEHQLNPIIAPKVEILNAKEGEDWQIRAITCEAPQIELKNYQAEIKKNLAPTKLWTPGKDKGKEEKEPSHEEKVQKVIETLLKLAQFSLPSILVEDELNRSLSSLINQANSLGMTIDQYAQSIGKTTTQLRQEYQSRVEEELKLLLILNEVVKREKVEVSDKEIDDLAKASGDQKLAKQLADPLQKEYLRGILARRKVLEKLASL
jgi:FKBP-type peptidyl-prolyl cis-trans isomerase (trigger factor)